MYSTKLRDWTDGWFGNNSGWRKNIPGGVDLQIRTPKSEYEGVTWEAVGGSQVTEALNQANK